MGTVDRFLHLPCPRSFDGISIIDHSQNPNWNLKLVSESVETNLNVCSKSGRGFVRRVFEDEIESEEEQDRSQIYTSGKRFAGDDDLSLVINDKKTQIEEEIRKQISVVENEILHETETFRSAIAKVGNYREARIQVEAKLDLQYQRLVQERARQEIARADALLQATIRSEEGDIKLAEERVAIRAEE
ncbi:unnamed protein product [Microthlaspi erraticum]|uniref:Uncharacterized protein n=1 Tax=Microthlaspi erraticum TaxID=1685480 RepID=A0A6D2IYW0_9BRAS|nr:unnamed protein product [Microthlaspi erraticum]